MQTRRVPVRLALVAVPLALVLAGLVGLAAPNRAPPGPGPHMSGSRIRAHIAFLADDLLEGREAGTRGFDIAAHYAATELSMGGLAPAAEDGSFFQKVPLRKSSLVSGSLMAGPSGSALQTLRIPEEAVLLPNSRLPRVELTAPVVYVGYGVTAPELHHDDYAGVDVKGKVALLFYNAPAGFPSELRAYYASPQQKLKTAADHGAVGVLAMFDPDAQKRFPWSRVQRALGQPAVTTLLADGTPVMAEPRIVALGYLSDAGARKLFAGAPLTIEQAYVAAGSGKPRSAALAATVAFTVTTSYQSASSENVVARLEGSDPALSRTSVVLTAHLDHIGLDPTREGDTINNGAYDNATGSAILLEVARAFGASGSRPRRSVVVVLPTAEEEGLLGSDYFARDPVKSAGRIVANVNLDMPVFMAASKDIVAFGSENSTLDAVVRKAIASVGYTLSPDPMPEENIFVRSDQYSFVRHGIPSVYLEPGFTATDPRVNGREVFEKFLAEDYHQPGDDLSLPFDEAAAARFASANYLIARAIADDPVAPTWKAGNFFGKQFGKTE
jgi:Zn-dependent M28 family amino/carboxypeptidase